MKKNAEISSRTHRVGKLKLSRETLKDLASIEPRQLGKVAAASGGTFCFKCIF